MIAVFFDYFPVKLLPLGVLNDNVEALRCVAGLYRGGK